MPYDISQQFGKILYRMETKGLLQPETMSQQIIMKLAHDFISRYQLKQQFKLEQFNSDTTRLQAELLLYHRSIHQVNALPQYKTISLQKTIDEALFKIFQFFVRLFNKYFVRYNSYVQQVHPIQNRCHECSSNFHAKQIQNVKRQLLDGFSLLSKKDLQDDQKKNELNFDPDYLTEEAIINKMMKLQNNLNEKQQGLMRCVDQFQDFRVNLMMGRPKYSDKDLNDKFNAKTYIIQVGNYFSVQLKNIQDKINNLKSICKKTEDFSMQCYSQELIQAENLTKTQLQNSKVANLKNEAEIRRLNQNCHKLEESVKLYSMEIKVLSTKVSELDIENHNLKQEVFIEKLKSKGKQSKLNQLKDSESKKNKQDSKSYYDSSIDMELVSQVLNQINERKHQIEEFGIKSEDVVPHIKAAFKKLLDGLFYSRKGSDRRKGLLLDSFEQYDSQYPQVIQTSSHKKNRSSMRGGGILGFMPRKEPRMDQFTNNQQQKTYGNLRLNSSELSYTITGVKRHGKKNYSKHIENSRASGFNESKSRDSKVAYKKSTLQTEGSLLKKRAMHIKLSSLSSEIKQTLNTELDKHQNSDIQYYNSNENEGNALTPQSLENDKKIPSTLNFDINQQNEWFKKIHHNKKRQSKASIKSLRKGSTLSSVTEQCSNGNQKKNNFLDIRKINGSRTIQPHIMKNFFDPPEQINKAGSLTSCNDIQIDSNADVVSGIKSIVNKLKSTGKMKNLDYTLQGWNSPKTKFQKFKRQPLRLEQISFMTAFSTLMAKSHLDNEKLYSQMRDCILDCTKENINIQKNGEQSMVKEIVGQLVTRHRKCGSAKSLCSHLSQFLDAFSSCIE